MLVRVRLSRHACSPAPVVTLACFPVRIQPRDGEVCKHICFPFSHSSSSLTLLCSLVSTSVLCSSARPALVTSLSISSSIPLQRAGLVLSARLLPTLTVTATLIHCLCLFFHTDGASLDYAFQNFLVHPSCFFPPDHLTIIP